MLQWFVDGLQRLVQAALRLAGALIMGLLRAPLTAADRAASPIDVRRGTAAEVVGLRHRVLREGRPRHTAIFEGDDDPATSHWVAVQADRVVGVASVMPRPMPEPPGDLADPPRRQLRGMAVEPALRGEGIGARLVEATHEQGQAMWCNARASVVDFYAKHGWQSVGPAFTIPEIGPHQRMIWSGKAPRA